ncbi:MAG: DegT/DnrJ/EryC1/StrS family aminotransferase [Candidatus Hydrogenedentes bacterium]|nr:DegT/DnrJ/EryC1/StrS family aminotransferase [Candidatus Hydrogenedentota bacterium]
MGKLALTGGKPVRGPKAKWPQWPVHDSGDVALLSAITNSNRWSFDGPYEWQFAKEFAAYHKSKFGICCANGTVGLQIAMEALDIGAFDEVIVPGMTWQATAAAVLDVNAIPVLVDVEPETWCLDLAKVEAAITAKTRAIIVVHLYGCMTDMTKLAKLCRDKGLYLIEDCAHQHGAFWKGRGVGTLGDIASFSFQESKVLSSGEGGFNMCQDRKLFERLYSLRNCGRGYKDDMTNAIQSGNFRITEWQAGILLGGLTRLDEQVKRRDVNAQYLNALLAQIPGVLPMRRRKDITQASYFNFTFRLDWDILTAKPGINNSHFGAALHAELNTGFEPPYEPLNACGLYKPHTKKRHHLNAEYWKKIDPTRFKLPVAEAAHRKNGLAVHHHVLLGATKDMDHIATAVAKVVKNIQELNVEGPQASRKRYRALAL